MLAVNFSIALAVLETGAFLGAAFLTGALAAGFCAFAGAVAFFAGAAAFGAAFFAVAIEIFRCCDSPAHQYAPAPHCPKYWDISICTANAQILSMQF